MATRDRTDFVAALFAVLVTTVGGPLAADPVRASLVVTRDDGSRECPDSAALAERVETVAGRELFGATVAGSRDTWVQVEFVRAITGFHVVISARGGRQGTRTLDDVGPECASLAEAVAVTLAILLDPGAASNEGAAPELPASLLAPTTRSVDVSPPPPRASLMETERAALAFGVEASTGASVGVLDGVVPLVEGGGRARFGDTFVLGAGSGFVLPDRVEFRGGSVGLSLPYGYARACANALPKKRTALETCLEAMLGGLRGEGRDYDANDHEWVLWSAAAALFQIYGRLNDVARWSLRARLLAPIAQHGFSIAGGGDQAQAFQISPLGGTLAFGIEAEL